MYYHVLIETPGMKIDEIDRTSLEEIEVNVIEPYIKREEFNFGGYFIEPSKVSRLLITESSAPTGGEYDPVYASFESPYTTNITRETLRKVKERVAHSQSQTFAQSIDSRPVENKPVYVPQPPVQPDQATSKQKTIFLAYSYRAEDEEFVEGFKDLLEDYDFRVLDGKADRLGRISHAIMDKINSSDIVVVVMNKRDPKVNGKHTTSAWLLEEKGVALAYGKQVAMLIEEEVDAADIGGLQGDDQLFYFTRNNFLKIAMNLIRIIK